MGGRWSSTRGKVLAAIRIGVPSRWVTPGLVDEVLAEAGQAGPGGQRFRALPGRLGVYFVLGLCLFSDLPYREVLRKLASGLGGALAAAGWQVPASTALTGVRRRLGENPFELLFWRLAGPLSPGRAPWSHICGLLAVAWDGTTVAAPASAANVACFGRLRGKKDGHYPLVRLVTLIACGTRALAPAPGCRRRSASPAGPAGSARPSYPAADRSRRRSPRWPAPPRWSRPRPPPAARRYATTAPAPATTARPAARTAARTGSRRAGGAPRSARWTPAPATPPRPAPRPAPTPASVAPPGTAGH